MAVYRYDYLSKDVTRVPVLIQNKFPQSFCYVQTPGPKSQLFLIEGDYDRSRACVELVHTTEGFEALARADMKYRRNLSSVTAVDENNLLVTGGLNPSS